MRGRKASQVPEGNADRGRCGRGPGTAWQSCRSVEVTSRVRGGYVAGPGNVWGPGTAERTKGRKASQVTKENADQGRYGRGPEAAWQSCRSVEVTSRVRGGYVAGPGNVWGPGMAECMEGQKASQVTKGNADQGRCGRGPVTVGPTLGIENRCRSVEVTSQVREGNADQQRHGWGPGTHQPGTSNGMAEDRVRTSQGPGTAECMEGRKASQVPEGNADQGRYGRDR